MKRGLPAGLLVLILLLITTLTVFGQGQGVKNLVLMIGDGMGIQQVTAARVASRGADGSINVDRIKYTGFALTHSANNLITDSGAAGTALATGYKTNNGFIAISPSQEKLKSILILAGELGKKVGIVTTTNLTDATPAAFGANNISRQNKAEIAADLLNKDIDLLLGGGLDTFGADPFTRQPKPNSLIKEAEKKGYTFIDTTAGLKNLATAERVLGLFNFGDLNYYDERFVFEPGLAEMTVQALRFLANEQGFFLLIEGGRIDDASHQNDPEKTIKETVEFDQAVGIVLDYAEKRGDTLVIVTADHQTGGFSLNGGLLDGQNLKIGWSTGGHSGSMVPVYAFGPGAINFTGTRHLSVISRLMAEQLGIKEFPQIYQ